MTIVGSLKNRPPEGHKCKYKDSIKMVLKYGLRMWTGYICLRLGFSCVILWTQ